MQIIAIKATLWFLAFFANFDTVTWDDQLVGGMEFLANSVLQAPFFLMSLMRYITPTLDHMYAALHCLMARYSSCQVHGLPAMGRPDLYPEAQVRGPKHPASHVLPKPPTLLYPR